MEILNLDFGDDGWPCDECLLWVLDSWISHDKNNKYRYLIEKLQAEPQSSDDFVWGIIDKAMFEIEDPLLRKKNIKFRFSKKQSQKELKQNIKKELKQKKKDNRTFFFYG